MASNPQSLISAFSSNPSDKNMLALVECFRDREANIADIALLAQMLAASGQQLSFDFPTYDIPSTGGPSSLSTIICPLILSAMGYKVPKLGVPGRPAGGIDTMAQIPGYRHNLTEHEVRNVLAQCGYAHFLADESFAPLDRKLFMFRRKTGNVAIPSLAVASLLSKKLAAGVDNVLLDVRVAPHGNFGSNFDEARNNSTLFCKAADALGIKAGCVLSDARQPYQPYIGRCEALLALYMIVQDSIEDWLEEHFGYCLGLCREITGEHNAWLARHALRESLAMHLECQGTSYEAFETAVREATEYKYVDQAANETGYISYDLGKIRLLLVDSEKGRPALADSGGFILLAYPGKKVQAGTSVIRARSRDESPLPIDGAYTISLHGFPVRAENEVVRNG